MNYKKYRLFLVFRLLGLFRYYKMYSEASLFRTQANTNDLCLLLNEARASVPFYKTFLPDISFEKDIIAVYRELNLVVEKSQIKKNELTFIDSSRINKKTIFEIQSRLPNFLNFFRKNSVIRISTGGTTGTPLNFYISKKRGVKFIMQFFAIAKYIGWNEEDSFMACVQGGMYQQTNFISKILNLIGSPLFGFKELNKQTAGEFALLSLGD